MDYINKRTGEKFSVEEVTLSNLCDGSLNAVFIRELEKLTAELTTDSKPGVITIKIKVDRDLDPTGDSILRVDTVIATKYPGINLKDDAKKITPDGQIVQKVESGIFSSSLERSDS